MGGDELVQTEYKARTPAVLKTEITSLVGLLSDGLHVDEWVVETDAEGLPGYRVFGGFLEWLYKVGGPKCGPNESSEVYLRRVFSNGFMDVRQDGDRVIAQHSDGFELYFHLVDKGTTEEPLESVVGGEVRLPSQVRDALGAVMVHHYGVVYDGFALKHTVPYKAMRELPGKPARIGFRSS